MWMAGLSQLQKPILHLHTQMDHEIPIGINMDYMNENPGYFTDQKNTEDADDNKEENFLLKIKLGDQVFISRIFPAHIYHPKARYAVDIRPKVRKILSDLTEILSSKKLNKTYLQYELK
jgi:hypothetical protein